MKINNEFTVSAPVDKAWEMILDLERVAPCLPGAALTGSSGDGYEGTMKVKIGPITANYKGTVKIEETDEANHRAVVQATGRDARGQGTASATIVSTMQEENGKTRVQVETDMKLTGRAAQFGRGIAQDVATKMLNQFAECLEEEIAGVPGEGAAATATEPSTQTNGSRDTTDQPSPGATVGGTAGRILSSEDPAVMAGGTVEGAIVSGPGSQEASTPTSDTGQTAAQQQRPRREQEAFDIGAASSSAILKRITPLLAGVGLLAVLIWLWRR